MTTATSSAAIAVARRRDAAVLRDLVTWLAIPSVSADPACAQDVRRAADWLADRLRGEGARVTMLGDRARPVVVSDFDPGPDGGPTVLVYGHYDVQPPGPGWRTAPFVPVVRDGRLVARGASDDKGQLLVHIAAVEALLRSGGLPGRIVVVAEGAEEIGSPGLGEVLDELRRSVRPSAVVVSDTRRASRDVPAVTVSQRGSLALDVLVDVGGRPVHPGRWGGAVLDPSLELGRVLRDLRAALRGAVAPARRRDDVLRVADDKVRRQLAGRATVADHLHSRITERASLHVVSWRSGTRASAVPVTALARVDVRVPPGADPARVARLLAGAARARGGARVSVTVAGSSPGVDLVHDPVTLDVLDRACRRGFGHPPLAVRSGGSLPAVALLREAFGVDPILLGLGPADDGAHGPDEYVDLSGWRKGVATSVELLVSLCALLPRPPATGSNATDTRSSRSRGTQRLVPRSSERPVEPRSVPGRRG